MGRRRRSFIDKKASETYQLIYRSTEDTEQHGNDRVFAKPHETSLLSDPLAHIPNFPFEKEYTDELTKEQEEEITELGLPLDGYNYLKHLRNLGTGKAELPIPYNGEQGGVFIPNGSFVAPQAENRLINAARLTIHSPALNEGEADSSMRVSTTTAFSRVMPTVKGTVVKEIKELDSFVAEFEGLNVETGDLLDSFVLDATEVEDTTTLLQEGGTSYNKSNRWTALPDDLASDDEDMEFRVEDTSKASKSKSIGRSRFNYGELDSSLAFSERWKGADCSDLEGRKPRTRPLEIIDETFESILEEYDKDEIERSDDCCSNDDNIDYTMMMEELRKYLSGKTHNKTIDPITGNGWKNTKRVPKKLGKYKLMKPKRRVATLNEKDKNALEATRQLTESIGFASSKREDWEHILVSTKSQKPLDCESSWSYRTHSTTYQPSIIMVQTKTRTPDTLVSTGKIKLSSTSGFPIDHHKQNNDEESVSESFRSHPCRSHEETLEEKKCRKQSVKQAQREARILKKQTKTLYRQEKIQQQKQSAGMITKNASVIHL